MAKGENAGDVRRRHHYRERLLLRIGVSLEAAIVDPTLIPLGLNGFWIVSLGKFDHRREASEAGGGLQNEKRTGILGAA